MKQQNPNDENAPPTILFVHIQKTAGTTLDQIIARNYRPGEVFALLPNAKAQMAKYLSMGPAEKSQIRLIKGHMHYGMHRKVPGPSAYFTFLREPIDRVISQYHHIRRSPLHPAHRHIVVENLDLKATLERGLDVMLFNAQVRVLSGARVGLPPGHCSEDHLQEAKRNLRDHFAVVGLTEEFDTSLLLLQKVFGWRRLYYTRRNVAPRRPPRELLSADTLAAVAEANRLDLELYSYAQTLFAQQVADYKALASDMARFSTRNQVVEPFLRSYLRLRRFSLRTEMRERLWRLNQSRKSPRFYPARLRVTTEDCPKSPIPEPLRGTEYGTFTHRSVVRRLPEIGRRMIVENGFNPAVSAKLEALLDGIPEDSIRPVPDDEAPDAADWNKYVTPHIGQNWLEVPWFFAETYFYRLVLQIVGYFSGGPDNGVDPFIYQKRQNLETNRKAARALGRQLVQWLDNNRFGEEALANLLANSLWSNQADLGTWPAEHDLKADGQTAPQRGSHVLVDDSVDLFDFVGDARRPLDRVDLILNAAGIELVTDLYLGLYLLEKKVAKVVHLHAKKHPAFVSAATHNDVSETVAFLAQDQDKEVSLVGQRLNNLFDNGRLRLQDDWFWTSPLAMWQMPERLLQEFDQSQLVISKGDANYRRLLGDRFWPYTTPFADIVCYMPASTVALRLLNSEIVAGLREDQPQNLTDIDPAWLYNRRWGVIQFARLA